MNGKKVKALRRQISEQAMLLREQKKTKTVMYNWRKVKAHYKALSQKMRFLLTKNYMKPPWKVRISPSGNTIKLLD